MRNLHATVMRTPTRSDSVSRVVAVADGTPAYSAKLKCTLATVFSAPRLAGLTATSASLASLASKPAAASGGRKSVTSRDSLSPSHRVPRVAAAPSAVAVLVDATLAPRVHLTK